MATKTKHVVTINGRQYRRTSERRVYSHAIAVLRNIERGRQIAFGWSQAEQESAEEDFRFYMSVAEGRVEACNETRDRAQKIAGIGLTGMIHEIRAAKERQFEDDVAAGKYLWQVEAWSGSSKLASSAAKTLAGKPWFKSVKIIQVGAQVLLEGE